MECISSKSTCSTRSCRRSCAHTIVTHTPGHAGARAHTQREREGDLLDVLERQRGGAHAWDLRRHKNLPSDRRGGVPERVSHHLLIVVVPGGVDAPPSLREPQRQGLCAPRREEDFSGLQRANKSGRAGQRTVCRTCLCRVLSRHHCAVAHRGHQHAPGDLNRRRHRIGITASS